MAEPIVTDHVIKRERITSDEQLRRWVDGDPVHRIDDALDGGECCPDFSCCKPDLLASQDIRRAFAAANDEVRTSFLMGFLGELVARQRPDLNVHITSPEAKNQ